MIKLSSKRPRTLLAEVGSKRSSDPRLAIGEAEIQELKGNTNGAIDAYLEAIRRGERDLSVVRRVLQLLNETERYNEAQLVLGRIQDQSLMSSEMQRIASEISFRNDDLTRALELAEQAVADGSKNYSDYLWLGQMRFANGRRDEAEESFVKAVELAPEQPAAVVGLVTYYVAEQPTGQGRRDRHQPRRESLFQRKEPGRPGRVLRIDRPRR